MQLLKPLSLLGLVATLSLNAGAQTATQQATISKKAPTSFATVDSFGNVVKTTRRYSQPNPSVGAIIAQQGIYGPQNSPSTVYCPPSYPYPPTNFGVTNNYFFPEQPYSIPFDNGGNFSSSITVIPLGTAYTTYSNYPNYGGYAAPQPYPGYAYPPAPYGAYPGYGYPAYGTTTTTTITGGTGYGSVSTQSQNNGFGVSIGRGGVSVKAGSQNSSSSTVVRPY